MSAAGGGAGDEPPVLTFIRGLGALYSTAQVSAHRARAFTALLHCAGQCASSTRVHCSTPLRRLVRIEHARRLCVCVRTQHARSLLCSTPLRRPTLLFDTAHVRTHRTCWFIVVVCEHICAAFSQRRLELDSQHPSPLQIFIRSYMCTEFCTIARTTNGACACQANCSLKPSSVTCFDRKCPCFRASILRNCAFWWMNPFFCSFQLAPPYRPPPGPEIQDGAAAADARVFRGRGETRGGSTQVT